MPSARHVTLDSEFPVGMTWIRNQATAISDQLTTTSNQVATLVDVEPVSTLTKSSAEPPLPRRHRGR